MPLKDYNRKQMGDACEMLVAAELTLAGVPAMKMPDNWPEYDIVAQPIGGGPAQKISVKSRTFKRGGDTFVDWKLTDRFDWLAIVLLPGDDQTIRRYFIVPHDVAESHARKGALDGKQPTARWLSQQNAVKLFADYENNFCLFPTGIADLKDIDQSPLLNNSQISP